MFVALPTNDDLSMVLVQSAMANFPAFRADVGGSYHRALELSPTFAERVRAARQAEPFRGSADLINVVRRAHGPGWALVGDAGFCQDPIRAQGIMDAFLDVERLVEAVDAGLSGRQPLDVALAAYEEERDAVAFPSIEATLRAAEFRPDPPEERSLRAALRACPELASLYVGVSVGTVSPEEFCIRAPSDIRRLFQATRAQAGQSQRAGRVHEDERRRAADSVEPAKKLIHDDARRAAGATEGTSTPPPSIRRSNQDSSAPSSVPRERGIKPQDPGAR
jgi:hypothetical protein